MEDLRFRIQGSGPNPCPNNGISGLGGGIQPRAPKHGIYFGIPNHQDRVRDPGPKGVWYATDRSWLRSLTFSGFSDGLLRAVLGDYNKGNRYPMIPVLTALF